MDSLSHNLREINSLNQRGGRMLSIVDLIEDGTLDVPSAGYLLAEVARGASFLCAAGPGGVGKTTLMACLLSFLPPDERIVTVLDPRDIGEPDGPECYLCHEIGAGHWYGYLWGDDAARYLALGRQGRIAASLHADTVEELSEQLLGPQIGADPADLARVDLLLFMVRDGGRRRVSAVYEADPGDEPAFTQSIEWRRDTDSFHLCPLGGLDSLCSIGGAGDPRVAAATDFVQSLVDDDCRLIEDVMAAVADFHGAGR